MVTAEPEFLAPELMDVVRLFEGAETLEIFVRCDRQGGLFTGEYTIDGKTETKDYRDETEGNEKSLIKRYAKLGLYELLSAHFQKELPWGSLTGIRPTRLAYAELEKGRDFHGLFRTLRVSEENTALVGQVIEGQRGIYEKKEGNVDLYVSLPFCPSKCDYCSFITAPIGKTRQYVPAYLGALERELSAARGLVRNLRSIYIGGGTPFALEEEELGRVFEAVAPFLKDGVEYTVEAGRPDVFTRGKLDLCKKYGVTRICINAQSFSDRTLEAIGRKHTKRQLYEAFDLARPYGFTVNCDLIAGLSGEGVSEFSNSLSEAIALAPENITVHTLCLKKGAKLKEETARLQEGELGEMIALSREVLRSAGYGPYYLYRQKYMAGAHENVGWTKKGYASVYNVDVMEETTDNLAVGANAIGKKLFLREERIERLGSPKDIPTYLSKTDELIEKRAKLFETGLR